MSKDGEAMDGRRKDLYVYALYTQITISHRNELLFKICGWRDVWFDWLSIIPAPIVCRRFLMGKTTNAFVKTVCSTKNERKGKRACQRETHMQKQWNPMLKAESQKHDVICVYDFTCYICKMCQLHDSTAFSLRPIDKWSKNTLKWIVQ